MTCQSRRLARNFVKLGLDDPEDFEINRDLARTTNITTGISQPFYKGLNLDTKTRPLSDSLHEVPSKQKRFRLDPEFDETTKT